MDNLYYRPYSQRNGRRSIKNKLKNLNFLVPFGIVLVIILLLFGLVKIWGFFADMKGTSFNDSATVYLVEGTNVQKQSYGSSQFFPLLSGDILLEGDSVRTLQNSKAVIQFFNELVVRLDEGTTVTVDYIKNEKNKESIELTVTSGSVWLNKPESLKSTSDLIVKTNYLRANTVGTIFEVKAGLPESVKVIDGAVLVDILDTTAGEIEVLDQVNVNVNQQITLDNTALVAFQARELPRVLSAIDSDFKASAWYKWNRKEDQNPSNYSSDSSLGETGFVSVNDETADIDSESNEDDDENLDSETVNEDDSVKKARFTFPKSNEVINTDTVTITGTVPVGTQAVVVTSFESGTPSPYTLKGFKPGDTTFKYIAKYIPDGDGNLVLGTNKYEVYAVDQNAKPGPKSTLNFKFELEKDNNSQNTTNNSDSTSSDISGLEFSEDLPAPTFVSINDIPAKEGFLLTEPRAVLVANIGSWAKSVVVNGYKLQQYVPYSGSFSYILSPGFNTLKPGENKVTAYGFAEDGRRGLPVTITVIYQP